MVDPRFPILFITATRIGDAVLSSGLIKRLLDEIPHARFTVVADARGGDEQNREARIDHCVRL